MMQPVYLNAPTVCRVTLEGPALRIHSRDAADRYFPLRRLGRIITRGKVQWSTAALLECMKMGVPITFLDREGRALGQCYSAWAQNGSLSELLDGCFTVESGMRHLVDWFRSQSRARMLKLLRRHGLQTEDLRVCTVRNLLRQCLKVREGTAYDPVSPMKPLLTAHVLEIFASYRIGPEWMEPGHEWEGLAVYMAGVEEWDLWDLALGGRLKMENATYQARVAAYQRQAAWLEKRVRDLVGKLWRWLERGEGYL